MEVRFFQSRMVKIGDINPKDKGFWPDNPDPGFSPERNKSVVEKTIAKYELMRKKKMDLFLDALKERTSAIASYLAGPGGAHKSRTLDQYFGRRYLAKLRGEEIVDELRERLKFVGVPTPPKLYDGKGKLLGNRLLNAEKKIRQNAQ